ncbi:MAG: patatin-like phospholipase family protein [Anaerolineae bacterium]|nr:patatin-like phospholipase family protein [Anaerolineae bacterium]
MRREIPQVHKKPGTALVLSGGATKAFYFHLGVLKALGVNDVTAMVGSSAGAMVAALVAMGTTVDDLITAVHEREIYVPRLDTIAKSFDSSLLFRLDTCNVARQSAYTGIEALRFFASLPLLWRQDLVAEALDRWIMSQRYAPGFFSADAIENIFKSMMPSNDFRAAEIDLYVTATSLDSHQRAVFNARYAFEDANNYFFTDVPVHQAVRASVSLPGMFEPVSIRGKYYIDGEVKQTLSVDLGLALADRIVISHTYQPLYRNDGQSIRDMGWLTIFKQALHVMLNERIEVWRDIYEHEYPDKHFIWIHPDPEDTEFFLAPEFSFRPEIQKMIIRSGEVAALKALENAAAQGG